MESIQIVLTVLTLMISFSTVCTLIYGFVKFLAKPHNTIEQRLTTVEVKQDEFERSIQKMVTRCEDQDDTNEVLIHSTLALIEFEIQYCLTEKKTMSKDLERAKDDLHRYLAKK